MGSTIRGTNCSIIPQYLASNRALTLVILSLYANMTKHLSWSLSLWYPKLGNKSNTSCNFQLRLLVGSRRPNTTIDLHQFVCNYWHVHWTLLLFKVLILLPANIKLFFISLFFFYFLLCVLVVFHLCVWKLAWSASDEWAAPDQNSLEVWWPEQTHDKSTMPGHMGLVQPTNNQEPANNQRTTNEQPTTKNNDLVQPLMAWANTW